MPRSDAHPRTPDGRYLVVRGRLWRLSDPARGERGPVWWTDGTPDHNRAVVEDTSYARWFAGLGSDSPAKT